MSIRAADAPIIRARRVASRNALVFG